MCFSVILQSNMIIKSMLKLVRRHAGLGDPPGDYYNNVSEAANAMIKRAVNFKKNEMPEFCNTKNLFEIESTATLFRNKPQLRKKVKPLP